MKKTAVPRLTEREIATVLHALRVYQTDLIEECGACDHFEDFEPLTDAEVDELCERINCTEETARMKNDLGLRLKLAWGQGELYATCLMPGLIFLGAGPAAESKGYAPGTPEYRMFLGAALDILQHKRVVIDEQHRIVEIGANL